MSLADELFEANQTTGQHPYDELGLAVWDNVQYFVARALFIANRDRKDEFTIYQPHMRGDDIYFGNKPLEENYTNFVKLTKYTKQLAPGKRILFWEMLKEYLPRLNRKVIQISDNIFYDVEAGELKTKEDVINGNLGNQEIREQEDESSGDSGEVE